jgi:hypothetical protein
MVKQAASSQNQTERYLSRGGTITGKSLARRSRLRFLG